MSEIRWLVLEEMSIQNTGYAVTSETSIQVWGSMHNTKYTVKEKWQDIL
jgi:hypothetical protein